MYKIAIVDDDLEIQQQLIQYMKKFENEEEEKFNITTYIDAGQLTKDYKNDLDIILMDIEMKGMDGMTGAEIIRAQDTDVVIIFVTNMASFAIKGYRVNAMSYIVKPILYVDFAQQIHKALKKINYKKSAYILLNMNNELIRVDVSKICYMEKREHRVLVKTETEELYINGTIKKLEEEVREYHFIRCNSGVLVSLSHVDGVEDNTVCIGDDRLPISRPKKKIFMNALSEFIGGDYR